MKEHGKCCVCGSRGRRHCPALDGMICPRCCGSKRGSELECPADCPHFPFGVAAYSLWLEVDESWICKAAKYVASHLGQAALNELVTESRWGDKGRDMGEEAFLSAFGLAVHRALFRLPASEGRTLADRWEEERWRGLTNDERVMMRHRRHSFPTVIEVQKVLSDQALECVDLLERDPKPFVMFDRSTAARAIRFDRLLTWVCHYPHFSRLGPAGIPLPGNLSDPFIEELRFRASDVAPEREAEPLKRYLASHFAECCALVSELSEARFQQCVRSMDVHHCTAQYDIEADRAEVERVLRSKPDFEVDDCELEEGDPPGTDYYAWLRRGESKALEKDMPAFFRHDDEDEAVGGVGNVKLLPHRLVVETFSRQKHRFARKMVDTYLGGLVSFRGEAIEDLAKQVAERRANGTEEHPEDSVPESRRERVPPEVEQQLIGTFMRNHYRKFLDAPVPALQNMTPRDAASDPAMRPQLIELMKAHIHSVERQSRSHGIDLRIDWVIDELGLTELQA